MLSLLLSNNRGTVYVVTLVMTSILAMPGATFTSMAIFENRNAPIEDSARTLQEQRQLRGWAFWGDEGVRLAGHPIINSYNSDDGLYEEQPPRENGNIRSNEDIELSGNCTIYGNVTPGPDGCIYITSGTVIITGSTKRARRRIYFPPPEINFTGSQPLKKSGLQTYTLTDGTYYFSDIDFTAAAELMINGDVNIYCESASFTGSSKITVNGTLRFYCTGDFVCTGAGIINTSKKPENFILCSTGETVRLAFHLDFYGAVYAPNAYIDMNATHDYYGGIMGRYVNSVGTGQIHYDEALMDIIGTSFP